MLFGQDKAWYNVVKQSMKAIDTEKEEISQYKAQGQNVAGAVRYALGMPCHPITHLCGQCPGHHGLGTSKGQQRPPREQQATEGGEGCSQHFAQ